MCKLGGLMGENLCRKAKSIEKTRYIDMIMPNYCDNCPIFISKLWSQNSHNLHILACCEHRWEYFGMKCVFSISLM